VSNFPPRNTVLGDPQTLEEAVSALIAHIPKEEFSGPWAHFGLGMWVRNNLGLWDKESPLAKYFCSIGIGHPDDMWGILSDCIVRKFRNEPFDLEGQVKYYRDYWVKQDEDPDKFVTGA